MNNEINKLEHKKNEIVMLVWLITGVIVSLLPMMDSSVNDEAIIKVSMLQILIYIIGVIIYLASKNKYTKVLKYYMCITFSIIYFILLVINAKTDIWILAIPMMIMITAYTDIKLTVMFDIVLLVLNFGVTLAKIKINKDNLGTIISDYEMQIMIMVIIAMSTLYILRIVDYTYKRISVLSEKVVRDGLTGVYNRYFIDNAFLNDDIYCDKVDMSFAIIDIDNFKNINDTYGHKFGDIVLKELALIIQRETTGDNTYVIRMGGDEFSILSFDYDKDSLGDICKNILSRVNDETLISNGKEVKFNVSIGVASESKVIKSDYNKVYTKADLALYRAKNNGKAAVNII